jgi:exodeoxyribonuclease-3
MKLCSWNVNGIRAVAQKGFFEWLNNSGFDVVCLQETKAQPDQLEPKFLSQLQYPYVSFNSAERKGYSGVANYFRNEPQIIKHGFDVDLFSKPQKLLKDFNSEGRIIESHHKLDDKKLLILLNIYFPNGGSGEERLKFKLEFYEAFLDYLKALEKISPYIAVTGDYNTAHHEIDLARPKENINISGFMPIEREYLDRLQQMGYIDTFRYLNPAKKDSYTWWSFRTAARKRNVGWRIDYFFVSSALKSIISDAKILDDVMGSDHCPVTLELKI